MREGAQTSFDILGSGLKRNYRRDNVSVSWYTTGLHFANGFDFFKNQFEEEKKQERTPELQR